MRTEGAIPPQILARSVVFSTKRRHFRFLLPPSVGHRDDRFVPFSQPGLTPKPFGPTNAISAQTQISLGKNYDAYLLHDDESG
jgi:hypothetical protein